MTAEGTVTRTDSNGYSTDIDSDSDGNSDLVERRSGTNPLCADSSSSVKTSDDDDIVVTPETPPETTSMVTADPAPVTSTAPTAETPPEDATDTSLDTSLEVTPDPVTAMADVIVPRVASSSVPVIDGKGISALGANGELIGEWAAAIQVDNSGASLLIDNLQFSQYTDETAGSFRFTWAAMHDGLYLYLLVLVDDAGDRHRDSGSAISEDDSVEIFLDGGNNKSQSYDANDFNQLFPLQLSGDDAQSTTGSVVGSTLASAPALSIRSATGPGNGPVSQVTPESRQDVYEIRIGLASAGVDIDEALGFEIIVNDDGCGESNAQWSWKLPSGSTGDLHQQPSLFGTLVLE